MEELLGSRYVARLTVGSLALRPRVQSSRFAHCSRLNLPTALATPTALALVDASVLREASDDVIAEVAKLLQALAGGGADGDSAFEDAVAADTHALVHVAVVAAVKCGLHGGLRLGKLLATVLPFWDEPLVALPATLKRVYAKFAKDRTPEEHAAVEFDALTEAFARCDDYEEDVLEPSLRWRSASRTYTACTRLTPIAWSRSFYKRASPGHSTLTATVRHVGAVWMQASCTCSSICPRRRPPRFRRSWHRALRRCRPSSARPSVTSYAA